MTLAVVVVAEAVASGSTPTAGLDLDDGPVIGRLLDMLASVDVGDRRVIARPEYADLVGARNSATLFDLGVFV